MLQTDNLVTDKHRNAPSRSILAHLRQTEFRILIHEVERVFVGCRFEREHNVVARCGEITSDDNRLRIENVNQDCILIDREGRIVMLTRLYNPEEFASLVKKINEMLK